MTSRAHLSHLQRRCRRRSARRASAMARKTIKVDYLARVEGEGALQGRGARRRGRARRAEHFRAAAVLRGVSARARLLRGAGHHRADLRHLPGRLPDERDPRDGARPGRSGRRPAARPAPAALLRRMDREPRAARLHAACARLPRLRRRHRHGARSRRCGAPRAGAEEGRQRDPDPARRARDPSDQCARRRVLPRAHAAASFSRWPRG